MPLDPYFPLAPAGVFLAGGIFLLLVPQVLATRLVSGLTAGLVFAGAAWTIAFFFVHNDERPAEYFITDRWMVATNIFIVLVGLPLIAMALGASISDAAGLAARVLIALAGTSALSTADHWAVAGCAACLAIGPLVTIPGQTGKNDPTRLALWFTLAIGLLGLGIAAVWSASGSGAMQSVRSAALAAQTDAVPVLYRVGATLIVCAFAALMAAAPLHSWAAETYEKSGTHGTVLIATITLVVGFVGLVRLVVLPFAGTRPGFGLALPASSVFWILAVVSSTLGSILAVGETGWRRASAFLITAQVGHVLGGLAIGALAVSDVTKPVISGWTVAVAQFAAMAVAVIGMKASIAWIEASRQGVQRVDDLAGAGHAHRPAAACLVVCLAGLIGLPPTAPFWGKVTLLLCAMTNVVTPTLAISVAVVTIGSIAIQAAVLVRVWFILHQPVPPPAAPKVDSVRSDWRLAAVVAGGVAVTLIIFGLWPGPMLDYFGAVTGLP
jgi:NADH-quinone oxidoreductase subunit N